MNYQFWINICIGVMFILFYGWLKHIEKHLKVLYEKN